MIDVMLNLKTKERTESMKTEFINLTELWQDGEYSEVGTIINNEAWSPKRVAEFSAYVAKYLGLSQLNILYKFL